MDAVVSLGQLKTRILHSAGWAEGPARFHRRILDIYSSYHLSLPDTNLDELGSGRASHFIILRASLTIASTLINNRHLGDYCLNLFDDCTKIL